MSLDVGTLQATLKLNATQFDQAISSVPAKATAAGAKVEQSMAGAGRATAKAGEETQALGGKLGTLGTVTSGLDSKFKSAATAIGGLYVGGKLISFLSDSVSAASDLNETINKSSVVFGQSAGEIDKWASTASTSMGLSKQAALESAASFGNLFTQLGFGGKEAAKLSTSVVQMSADLGSFNNLPTADVADSIAGAFRGEYDSLQKLIPSISDARVKAEAMAETGKKSADALTEQEKATAVLTIVQQDGAKAMGDFARTADGFANSQKTAAAQLEETKAAIGEKLLPVMQSLLKLFQNVGVPAIEAFGAALGVLGGILTPVVNVLASLPAPVLAALAAFVAFKKFGGGLGSIFQNITQHVTDMISGFNLSAESGDRLGKALNGIGKAVAQGGAFALIGTVIAAWSSNAERNAAAAAKWQANVDDLAAALVKANGEWDNSVQAVSDAQVTGSSLFKELIAAGLDYGTTLRAIQGNAQDLATTQQAMRDAGFDETQIAIVTGLGSAYSSTSDAAKTAAGAQLQYNHEQQVLADISKETGSAVSALGSTFSSTAGAVKDYAAALEPIVEGARNARTPLQGMSEELGIVSTTADEATTRIEFFGITLDKLNGINISAERATQLLNDQVRQIGEAFKGATEATDGQVESLIGVTGQIDTTTQAGSDLLNSVEDYRGAYDTATQSAYDQAVAQGDVEGALGKAQEAAQGARDKFLAQADALGINRDQAIQLADRYGILDATKISDKNFKVNSDDEQARRSIGDMVGAHIGDKNFGIFADASQAQAVLDNFINRNVGRSINVVVNGVLGSVPNVAAAVGGGIGGGASGGRVGALLGFSDGGKVPGRAPMNLAHDNMLMAGPGGRPLGVQSEEWIIRTDATRYYGDAMMDAINNRTFPKPFGFADGGRVGGGVAASAAAPVVQVFIGGDDLTDRIDVRVDGKLTQFATALGRGLAQAK